jgi:hypothetical protein
VNITDNDAPRNAVLSSLLPLPPSLVSKTKQHIANRNARRAINSTLAITRHTNSHERRAINSTLAITCHTDSHDRWVINTTLATRRRSNSPEWRAINSTLATRRRRNSPEWRAINSTLANTRHSKIQSTTPLGMQPVTWSARLHM